MLDVLKNYIFLVLMFIVSFSFFSSLTITAQNRNVIMLLDKSAESILNPKHGSLCRMFNAALDYGDCSIIASGTLLHAWFFYNDQFKNMRVNVGDLQKNAACFNLTYECGLRRNELEGYQIYKCLGTNEYLFIPNKAPAFIGQGFNRANNKILMPLTTDQLQHDLKAWDECLLSKSSWKILNFWGNCFDKIRLKLWFFLLDVKWKNLKDIFTPGTSNWIFYINGHAWYTGLRFQKKEKMLECKKEYLMDFNNFFYCPIICGLKITDHHEMLHFLGTTIKTLAVYETTCWLGGYHLQQIIKQLEKLEHIKDFKSYKYICGSLIDTGVYQAEINEYDFPTFFKQLGSYFKKENQGNPELSERLKSALKAITPQYHVNSSLSTPLYYDPSYHTLQVIDVYDELSIIKNEDAQKIKIINDKKAILFPYLINNSEIILKVTNQSIPFFISMVVGDAVHVIPSLEVEHDFNELLKNAFYGFLEIAQKVFIIKQIYTKNYQNSGIPSDSNILDLQDVIIEKKWKIQNRGVLNTTLKISGNIYCKLKGKAHYYKATVHSSYNNIEPLSIGRFIEISKPEFDNKINSYI